MRYLNYLNWLYNPFKRWDVAEVYDLLATDVATRRGLYLNLGYWEEAQGLDEACEALTDLVARRAEMAPKDQVLDVGYGFGDQDIHWMSAYQPAQIIGLNITASQVALARQRIVELGLEARIDLREGSATDMPLPDASVDKVVALECAFHFDTRERFFSEAMRVLRPGGLLVTADITPLPTSAHFTTRLKQRWSWGLVAGKFSIPDANAYTRVEYHERLAHAGFHDIGIESIRDHVYAPLHAYLRRRPDTVKRLHPAARFPAHLALRISDRTLYGGLDYLLCRARKPE